jgi:hypothetical protein
MPKKKSLKERMAIVLSASDKTYIKNNGDKFTLGYLIQKLGKSSTLIEKELRRLGITPLSSIQNTSDEPLPILNGVKEFIIQEEVIVKQIENKPLSILNEVKEKVIAKQVEHEPIIIAKVDAEIEQIEIAQNESDSKISKKRFTEEEINYIRKHSAEITINKIAKHLNRSFYGVRYIISRLGLPVKIGLVRHKKILTDKDIAFIRKNHSKFFIVEIAEKINHSTKTVSDFCKTEGLKIKTREIEFTQSELDFIRENNGKILRKDMAAKLGREVHAIQYVISKFKWYESAEVAKERRSKMAYQSISPPVIWTPVEEAFVRYNFGKMPYQEMADILKTKGKRQISDYCVKNKMIVTPEMMTQNRMRSKFLNRQKKKN